MGSYFTQTTCRLAPGKDRTYDHRFGGKPRHKGVVPPGQTKPVTLLYDLDLRDPKLGLNVLFPGLTRLPLLVALKFNSCPLLYHVVSDDRVELQPIPKGSKWSPIRWNKDCPFKKYPRNLPETPIRCAPYEPHLKEAVELERTPFDYRDMERVREEFKPYRRILKRYHFPFPVVGDRVRMIQGFPEWQCPKPKAKCSKINDSRNKQVFAVIWEWPIPSFHLWSDDPMRTSGKRDHGFDQIIFSHCNGCGIVHSSSACD